MTLQFRIHGLHCAHEVALVRRAFEGDPGVLSLDVELVSERLAIKVDPTRLTSVDIVARVASTGLRAEPWQSVRARSDWRQLAPATLSAAALALAVVAETVTTGSLWDALVAHEHADSMVTHGASVVAMAAALSRVLPRAVQALRHRHLDMHVLVVCAMAGAVALGEWIEGAMVLTLFVVADAIEASVSTRTRRAIEQLAHDAPSDAVVWREGGEVHVPIAHVHAGDVLVVRPGARVLVDGVIESGRSGIDETAVTGESVPVLKGCGDSVRAGSVNGHGALRVRATCCAAASQVTRLAPFVEQARARKASTERWVAHFASRYTPLVLMVAVLVAVLPPLVGGGAWDDWSHRGLLVMLVSCPCALVLATPLTLAAALASAARRGVFFKGGDVIEVMSQVRTLAFDKTGVLTEGALQVVWCRPWPGLDERAVLARLAAAESGSEHPLACAVQSFTRSRGIVSDEADDVRALPGQGVEASFAGCRFWVGSVRLAQSFAGGTDESRLRAALADAQREGLTLVLCGDDAGVWAALALRDRVRPEIGAAVTRVRAITGGQVALVTGDHEGAARHVADVAGIDRVHAGLLPGEKAIQIEEWRRGGASVAMVGDGLNDTAALAVASVGVAFGRRSADAAMTAADVLITAEDLTLVPWTLAHARRAMSVVRQNIWLAIGLKVAFIVALITVGAPLWLAVLADSGAAVLVTINGARLLNTSVSR